MSLDKAKHITNDDIEAPYIIINGSYVYLGTSVTIGTSGTTSSSGNAVATSYVDLDGGSFDSTAPIDGGFYLTKVWANLYDGGTP
jgi:hypothetical protein